jgi:hypothetical protein
VHFYPRVLGCNVCRLLLTSTEQLICRDLLSTGRVRRPSR